jgi:hypothetical protein
MSIKKSVLSLTLFALGLSAETYHSIYGTSGFKDVMGLSTYNSDYILTYNGLSSWSVSSNMLVFIPKGAKEYAIKFNRVGSEGYLSGYMSFGKVPNISENIEGKNTLDYHSIFDYLISGNTASFINKTGLNIFSTGMSEDIEYNKSGWIHFKFIPATMSLRDDIGVLPTTGTSGVITTTSTTTTTSTVVASLSSLTYSMIYTLDKPFIDKLVENMEVPVKCEGKIDSLGKSIEKLCTYIESLNTDKTGLDTRTYILRDSDPVEGLTSNIVEYSACDNLGDMQINSGWNLLGTSTSISLSETFSKCFTNLNVWTFDNNEWKNDSTSIKKGQGFWLKK